MSLQPGSVTEAAPLPDGPWLSILVPIYNVSSCVEECVVSILDQVRGQPGIELIFLDDRSTDESADLCQHFIAHQSNARLLRHAENRGPSAARNSMLEVAKGDYIWFIDSDDRILPGAIESLRSIVIADQPDVILCDYVREGGKCYATFDGPEKRVGRCTETLVAGVFAKRRLHIWSRVWKRDVFGGSIRFPEGACFEDAATVPWLLLKADSFYYTAEPWIYYRSRPDSIMARLAKARSFDVCRNDDMAKALTGFHRGLADAVPDAGPETLAVVARFQSREFVKIVKRLVRASWRTASWSRTRDEIGRYRTAMETESPVPFRVIASQYLAKRKVSRAVALCLALTAAKS